MNYIYNIYGLYICITSPISQNSRIYVVIYFIYFLFYILFLIRSGYTYICVCVCVYGWVTYGSKSTFNLPPKNIFKKI